MLTTDLSPMKLNRRSVAFVLTIVLMALAISVAVAAAAADKEGVQRRPMVVPVTCKYYPEVCLPDETCCNFRKCANLKKDPDNCGRCNHRCPGACCDGVCKASC